MHLNEFCPLLKEYFFTSFSLKAFTPFLKRKKYSPVRTCLSMHMEQSRDHGSGSVSLISIFLFISLSLSC